MKHVLWLLFALSSVYADSVLYTIESYTTDGKPCMSDCIDGTCKAGSSWFRKKCLPGQTIGYQYYTSLKESNKPLCRSRCGSFGTSYDWCYVTDELDWDYCSSNTNREVVKTPFTDFYGPCTNACAKRGYNYFWCNTPWFWPNWSYCKPDIIHTYYQSYSTRGHKCKDTCEKHGESYIWCEIPQGWDYCAVPAQSIFDQKCHGQCNSRSKRSDDEEYIHSYDECIRRPGLIRNLAASLESQPELITRRVNNPDNPVISYTVGQPSVTNAPQLPFVVRAHIRPQHLPPPNSRPSNAIPSAVRTNLRLMGMLRDDPENNNDEAGHLIAYQNGGQSEMYNFAPQTRRLHRGTNDEFAAVSSDWYADENLINGWVRGGGSVDEVVVVLYNGNFPNMNYRPIGFGTSLWFFNSDGTFNTACTDYFYSNDPRFNLL